MNVDSREFVDKAQQALAALLSAQLPAATKSLAANTLGQIVAGSLANHPACAEFEKRLPFLVALVDAFATHLGQAVHAWPAGAEREAARARVLAAFTKSYEASGQQMDALMSELDPLRRMRPPATPSSARSEA
ncbi:MAG: hypothetical protein K9G48_12750 [Reyranella sp.]|nr:hypothetical protein [Reyranella sp.]